MNMTRRNFCLSAGAIAAALEFGPAIAAFNSGQTLVPAESIYSIRLKIIEPIPTSVSSSGYLGVCDYSARVMTIGRQGRLWIERMKIIAHRFPQLHVHQMHNPDEYGKQSTQTPLILVADRSEILVDKLRQRLTQATIQSEGNRPAMAIHFYDSGRSEAGDSDDHFSTGLAKLEATILTGDSLSRERFGYSFHGLLWSIFAHLMAVDIIPFDQNVDYVQYFTST